MRVLAASVCKNVAMRRNSLVTRRRGFASELQVFWHDDVLLHDSGAGVFDELNGSGWVEDEPHPESASRLKNIRKLLTSGPLKDRIRVSEGRHATLSEIERFHDPAYVQALCTQQPAMFTPTTRYTGHNTWTAALAASGTTLAALEAVISKDCQIAYSLVRPPGHHAGRMGADGYCYLNNGAIAAEAAIAMGLKRVAILDIDVHHGNGAQVNSCSDSSPAVCTPLLVTLIAP